MDLDGLYDDAIAGYFDAMADLELRAHRVYEKEYTILHTESEYGNPAHVRFILKEFANMNLLTKLNLNQETALHLAAYFGHTQVAQVLIDAATHLASSSSSSSANENQITSFKGFLRHANKDMNTSLHLAVMEGNVDIVKLLVEADPTDRHTQNNQGKSPMYIAVENGFTEIVEIISTTCRYSSLDGPPGSTVVRIANIDRGSIVNIPEGTLYKIMDKDALYAAAIAGVDDARDKLEMEADLLHENGDTILHCESVKGNTELVRFILREFANKNLLFKLDRYKRTALHLAACYGQAEVVKVLIDAATHLPPSANDNTHDNQMTSFQAFLRKGDKAMDIALHIAVMEGNLAIVQQLVEADPTDKHFQNDQGKTPMYIAAEKGYNEIAEMISTTCTAPSLDGPHGSTVLLTNNLDQVKSAGGTLYKIMDRDALYGAAKAGDANAIAKLGMEADTLDEDGKTILHIESKNGNTERVRFILREFANKQLLAKVTEYCKHTALHLAIYEGHTEVAEVLIDAARHLPVNSFQAFLRQGDSAMDTALHFAVQFRHMDIVKLLVEADPTDRHIPRKDGKTPMYIAVEKGFDDIVEIISTTCTAPSLDGPNCSTVVRIKDLDQVKSPGGTLYKIMDKDTLYAAAIVGDADAIAKLDMQADILNKDDETILHIESRNGKTEHVRFILSEFANKNLLVKVSESKETALHFAVYNGNTEVAEVLIDAARHLPPSDDDNPITAFHAFIRHADQDLETALHAAVKRGHVAIVQLLVKADRSDRHIQNKKGNTPIYLAAEEGYTDIVKLICTTCTSPLNLDGPGGKSTALHAAIKNNNHDIKLVEVLIAAARLLPSSSSSDDDVSGNPVTSFQAFLRKGDEDRNTALHIAAMQGNLATATRLVEADPGDKHIPNNEGKTPIYIAAENGHMDIVKVICATCTAPLNLDGPGASTVLHAAIKNPKHDVEVVEFLIGKARHLPFSYPSFHESYLVFFLRKRDEDQNTALHFAVMQGNLATAKLLVEVYPTGPGIQNNQGETPFYTAIERGYVDIVKMICTTCTAPIYMDGPGLHAVIKNLDEGKNEVRDVIKIMIDEVKRPLRNNGFDEYKLHRAFADEMVGQTDRNGYTILELAVERNYVKVVELILDINNPAYRDEWIGDDFISLMPLIYKAKDKGYIDMLKLLGQRYKAGAKLSVRLRNQVSLISAIRKRQIESATSLLNHYAKDLVTFTDDLGWTALHHATYNECMPIIKLIVEALIKLRHQASTGTSRVRPVHIAAEKGYNFILTYLIKSWQTSWYSSYIDVDRNGRNILHLAALQSEKEMIRDILENCAKEYKNNLVNQQDEDGNTPHHFLVRDGCFVPEVITYEGLDIKVKNKKKWNAQDMLYFQDDIVGDQVQIKLVLDHVHIDQKMDIFSNSVLSITKREKKDAIFKEAAKLMIHKMHALMKEDADASASCFAKAIAGDPLSKAVLEMEADTLDQEGKTILHVECMRGVTERVRYIVREFANKKFLVKLDKLKQTALHLAAYYGHAEVVKVLIEAANNNLVCSYYAFIRQANTPLWTTALHLAVLNADEAVVKVIVQADPDDRHNRNYEGKTPIFIAAEKGYKDIVKEICTTCTALSLDGPGSRTTALHALIQNIGQVTEGDSNVIWMMVNAAKRWHGADFEGLFRRTDELGSTVLELAMEKNNVDAVEFLLQKDPAYEHGREIKRNGRLMRLIYKAIDHKCSSDIIKLLSQKYEAGIDPDHKDVLPLILAIKSGDEHSVLHLLGGAKQLVTFTEDNGWTPLHYAVYHEFDSIIGALIGAQEDAGHQFVYGNMVPTPFQVAVEKGFTSTLLLLMQLWPAASNSHYTAVDENGQNLLHLTAAKNNKKMVQDFLKNCPEKLKDMTLKQQDANGDTPLHLLISHGCFIPELIKDKRLDAVEKNKNGFTPRDMLYFQNKNRC